MGSVSKGQAEGVAAPGKNSLFARDWLHNSCVQQLRAEQRLSPTALLSLLLSGITKGCAPPVGVPDECALTGKMCNSQAVLKAVV
jgi:hypothetical protein